MWFARANDLSIINRERGVWVVRVEVEQSTMTGEMHGNAGCVLPCRLGLRKKFESFSITPLHFHHMGDDMNSAGVSRVYGEHAPRDLFGATILTVLLKTESIHRKNTCVAGKRFVPLGYHLGDTVSQHTSLTEAEINGMGNRKRQNVAWLVDYDCTITFNRESLVAFEPSTCRRRVAACRVVHIRTGCFNCSYARDKLRSRGIVVAPYNYRCTQTMGENELRVVSQHAVDLVERIAATREHELKRAHAPRVRIKISFICDGLCVKGHNRDSFQPIR